jgi:hypothetical protein
MAKVDQLRADQMRIWTTNLFADYEDVEMDVYDAIVARADAAWIVERAEIEAMVRRELTTP